MSNSRGLVFLHIPKTAGTTLRTIIQRQYPRKAIFNVSSPANRQRFNDLSDDARRKLRVVQGHVGYGVHTRLFVPVDYITMLRHPVQLVTSLYYFFCNARFREVIPLIEGKSLAEFADLNVYLVRNIQTRYLSGILPDPERTASWQSAACADMDDGALQMAKGHLMTNLAAFGVSDRFDESLLLFARRLAWKNIFYRQLNTNRKKPGSRDVPRSTIAIIERNNALDMELYDFAARAFDARVREMGPAFTEEVRRFQRMNPFRGLVNESYRRLRWEVPGGVSQRMREYFSSRAR